MVLFYKKYIDKIKHIVILIIEQTKQVEQWIVFFIKQKIID